MEGVVDENESRCVGVNTKGFNKMTSTDLSDWRSNSRTSSSNIFMSGSILSKNIFKSSVFGSCLS